MSDTATKPLSDKEIEAQITRLNQELDKNKALINGQIDALRAEQFRREVRATVNKMDGAQKEELLKQLQVLKAQSIEPTSVVGTPGKK